MNSLFQNAIARTPQKIPPVWFMRQAGRYHKHYQKLRAMHSFDQLCRRPHLAAKVALGPIEDFDFDVAILFSDILFPLDGLGFGLSYTDAGPKLQNSLTAGFKVGPEKVSAALDQLSFQAEALIRTRELLPNTKSLIGFVGGLWTIFGYACEGGHTGSMAFPKSHFLKDPDFVEILTDVIRGNIELQLKAGAEVVMIFDTAAGEVSHQYFKEHLESTYTAWAHEFPGKLGYYSKGTQSSFFSETFLNAPWAGRGVDHRWNLPVQLKSENQKNQKGFLQGNFDQALFFQETSHFEKSVHDYLQPYLNLSPEERAGWVCALGHGVLPKTPEVHVKKMIEIVRKEFQ